ncbi:MAG: hypothetical protein R3E68_07425 [Burkholderiaceae bacterium]
MLVTIASFLWQGHMGFNLWDEGFLWYGAQRTALGEVPIRDFMAYDPGRYYWVAAFIKATGNDGIMLVRAAVAVFQAVGLFLALKLVVGADGTAGAHRLTYAVLVALTLVLWMYPRHKLFDITLSIVLLSTLAALARDPILRRYVAAGACLGLVAFFGRNHGLYGAIASIGLILWLAASRQSPTPLPAALAAWGGGVLLGYLPMAVMALAVPGFANEFWLQLRFLFEMKATNLPLPVPWPWRADWAGLPTKWALSATMVGLFFIAVLAFPVVSLVGMAIARLRGNRNSPVLMAAAFLSLPYAHYAFSRADAGHLAQGLFPLLVGSLAWLAYQRATPRWIGSATLLAASVAAIGPHQPGWQCRVIPACQPTQVRGDDLRMGAGPRGDIELILDMDRRYAPGGESMLATPYWPGAYALLGKRAPNWEIYALFGRSKAFEMREIARIEAAAPAYALVIDWPLDGRDELRFPRTHPLTYRYLLEHYEQLPAAGSPIVVQRFRRKGTSQ